MVFGISAILNDIILKNNSIILWLCYPSLIILGAGFIAKSRFLIKSQLNILTIPLLIWTTDFIFFIITKNSFLGISDYFFQQGMLTSKIITSQHLFTIPLALFSIKFVPQKTKKSWIFSLIFISIMFILSRIIGSSENNLNFSYNFLNLNIPFYPLFWFLAISCLIFLTNFILKKLKF